MKNSPYKHKEVRDLHWLLTSPALLNANEYAVTDDAYFLSRFFDLDRKLLDLDENIEPLLAVLTRTKRVYKIGIYAESLLQFAIESLSEFELLADHVSVYEEKRAIGEFDFILRDAETAQVFHIELALKYFLLQKGVTRGGEVTDDYIGPGGRDRLGLKIRKLFERQLRLSLNENARPFLEKHSFGQLIPQAFTRGVFFYHFQEEKPRSHFLNAGISLAYWANIQECDEVFETFSIETAFVLPKKDWLSFPDLSEHPQLSASQMKVFLKESFEKESSAVKIAYFCKENQTFKKILFVYTDWPKAIVGNEPSER